jgi:VWFA-related protein
MRSLILIPLLAALTAALPANAQQVGQNTDPAGGATTYTMSVQSTLVIETVTVKDKKGATIDGLTAKDFTVTEDGAPQAIKIFEHQVLPVNPPLAKPDGPEELKIYKRLSRTQITPEPEGTHRYTNRRLIALYFDMAGMRPPDQIRAITAAMTFIRTQMTTADLVSILRYEGGSVDILQDFSEDHNKLLSILETMMVGEGQGNDENPDDASSADTGAAFGQDDSEFNIFNTDRQLSALQTAAKMLGQLNEKKQLIYFAAGVRLNGLDNQAQLHATVDAAIRSGVTLWTIDTRGLVAGGPLGDATQGSQGNFSMYSGAAALAVNNNFQQSQDTLYALAQDTGGKALLDTNDLTQGIVDAQRAVSNYYILGYYTTNPNQDGKFRKVKVSVAPELEAKLDFRQGYYAGKVFAKFTATDKERQLEDALMLADPITELTIAMEIDYFQLNRAEYFVPIVMKIPGRELALAKKGGASRTTIDFIGEIKDAVGNITVTNIHDKVDTKLDNATAEQLAKAPVMYTSGFTLLPGKYTIKVLARDDETGRIGTFQTNFIIPNLNKELTKVPISSVVLSGQKVEQKDVLYDAMKSKARATEASVDPLVENGAKLVPSVTRVFSKNHQLFVYLQAYEPGAPATQPLISFVTFYRKGAKVYETQPQAVLPKPQTRLGVVPLDFSISLEGLDAGEYDCEVTVLDPTNHHGTFWQAPIVLVP